MELDKLKTLVDEGLTIYKIAERVGLSYTTIRYWLRKHKLNTKLSYSDAELNGFENGRLCITCDTKLMGRKRMYCDRKCKLRYHYTHTKGVANTNTNQRQMEVSKERKLKLIDMSGGCCMTCGYKRNYSALVFHHRNPDNKTFSLDSRKLSNTNWKSILSEWAKCDLLCHNCHMELHYPDKLMVRVEGIEPTT